MTSTFTDRLQSIKINSHVSPYLTFYDPKTSHEYQMFKVAQSNPYSFLPLHLCNVFFFLFGAYSALTLNYDNFNIMNACVCSFFNIFLGNWILAVHFKDSLFHKESFIHKYITPTYISFLESFWIIGCAIDLSLVCVTIVHNGMCPASFEHVQIARGCNYSGDPHEVPMDLICALFFAPIICMVVLKGGSFVSVIIAVAINSITLFATMYFFSMHFEGPIILLFCPMCVLVLYEFQRQGISVFLLSQSQQVLLEEIDRLSNQTAKELRAMIGNVAHDLKTPMSAFMSGMDMISCELVEMQSDTADKEKLDKRLKFIADNVTHMMNINSFMRMSINRCIDYTKASNGMVLVPHMETVNFRDMLNLPLSCMQNLQNSKVKVELKPIPNEIASWVITDPQWFQENVLCLLSNAVKYSAEGVVSICVSLISGSSPSSSTKASSQEISGNALEKLADGMMIRLDIIDNGIGISDELKPRLFSPFRQAQRMAGGTGLGLYSLAKRMEAIGGQYGILNRSDGEQGCNFWFAIPYRPDKNHELIKQEETVLSPSVVGGDPVINRRELYILLVDDSVSILKMTGKMLQRMGHTVTTAENGAEALKMMSASIGAPTSPKSLQLPHRKFDVVLMDLQMPIMDGLEATNRLRALEKDLEASGGDPVHQVIIGMSANSDNETAVASFEAGVDDFIPKPFNSKTFEIVYQKICNKRGLVGSSSTPSTEPSTPSSSSIVGDPKISE